MKNKALSIVSALAFTVLLLAGCKDSSAPVTYKDGTYTGKSSGDDQDAKITDCQYVTWQKDGTIKDENYGKVNGVISNQDYYDKAQLAVKAMKEYAEKLVEVQKLEDVDAISGATIAFDQFQEAVNDALDEAKK